MSRMKKKDPSFDGADAMMPSFGHACSDGSSWEYKNDNTTLKPALPNFGEYVDSTKWKKWGEILAGQSINYQHGKTALETLVDELKDVIEALREEVTILRYRLDTGANQEQAKDAIKFLRRAGETEINER